MFLTDSRLSNLVKVDPEDQPAAFKTMSIGKPLPAEEFTGTCAC